MVLKEAEVLLHPQNHNKFLTLCPTISVQGYNRWNEDKISISKYFKSGKTKCNKNNIFNKIGMWGCWTDTESLNDDVSEH